MLRINHEPLLDSLAAESLARLSDTNGQNIGNTAWAMASLAVRHWPLLDAIAAASIRRRYYSLVAGAGVSVACGGNGGSVGVDSVGGGGGGGGANAAAAAAAAAGGGGGDAETHGDSFGLPWSFWRIGEQGFLECLRGEAGAAKCSTSVV
eukprot:NODE_16414_length_996_cov_2.892980.p3 GENE.NODE_16414_length_996_cov_2.892980~~NODE_16414_length_996_cov_2.892980.p3  ORF type:complete len:150 (-),score=43.87 NODE_16414_length_996_cov_2.892980:248-697(-)